jgi:imidazoleglycerol-phosphate dehydratase
MTRIRRETRETRIDLTVTREAPAHDGAAPAIDTGDEFLDHMLVTLARYSGVGLSVTATGDLRHHLVEDVAIALGQALRQEVPARAERFGWALVPMDEALVQAAVDVGGRPYWVGRLPSALYEHFLQSLAVNLGATLHVKVIRGRDRHHVVEAAVKATGLALRQALREGDGIFSTKGAVNTVLEEGGEG